MKARNLLMLGCLAALLSVAASRSAAQTTRPEAHEVLDRVREAYADLKSLRLEGTYALQLDAAGEQRAERAEFRSTFVAPNRFRHEMTDDALIVSTGEKAYLYVAPLKRYAEADVAEARSASAGLSEPIEPVLRQQNLSLYLALSDDAAGELMSAAGSVTLNEDVIDGVAYRSMRIEQDDRVLSILIDPKTSLIRRIEIDLQKLLESQGVPHVNVAQITVDYTRVDRDVPVDEADFAWKPPDDATAARDTGETLTRPDPTALVGKRAPAFTLMDLDGQQVALAEHKGSVVVLDFWATWCGPCRTAMPHLEQLHRDFADRSVKVLAINLRESRDTAKKFMEHNKLTMPVLLDATAAVAAKYAVTGIPQTVVIGKNGAIRKVIIGFAPGGEKQLREAVQQALEE